MSQPPANLATLATSYSTTDAPGIAAGLGAATVPGINLVDPQDPDVLFGYYIDNTVGVANPNYQYVSTGYIPVLPGETYVLSSGSVFGGTVSNRRSFYDKNKQFISGTGTSQPASFTIPQNAFYVRLSLDRRYWPLFQVEHASVASSSYAPPQKRASAPPLPNPVNRETLRQTHYLLAKLALPTPETAQAVMNLAGDSYTHAATRWSGNFAAILVAKYGDAGGGWCGFGFLQSGNVAPWTTGNQPSYLNGNVRPATYGTRVFGSIVGNYYSRPTADLASATLSASGDAIEQDVPALPAISGIDLHWVGTGNGSVRYGYAAQGSTPTVWTTLSVSGTSGTLSISALSLTGLLQSGTLRIEWVSGTAELAGVNLKSTANGVRVNKIAATGSAATQWGSAPGGFNTALASLGGNLFFYMDGPNSQTSATRAQWGSQLSSTLTKVRTAIPGIDVLIATPPENQRTTNTYTISAYATEARLRAYTLGYAYLDLQPAFGISGDPTEYGSAGTVPLFNSDLLHPEPTTGGRLMTAEFLRVVAPF